jgi:Protein of unknown function (DUF3293)
MPPGVMRPEDDPGWAAYGETILVFAGTPPLEIDLRRTPRAEERRGLALRGLDGSFGLVTPCNPRGHRAPPEENAALLLRFLAELDAHGKRYVRVDGVSPDRRHVERGVALAWSRSDVLALARTWQQSAVYWWDGASFWVIGALTDAAPWRLGGTS